MTARIAIVSGADGNYFGLLSDMVASLLAADTGVDFDLCLYDAGFSTAQRSALEAKAAHVHNLDWCMDFPDRDRSPGHHRLRVCRPFMPRHFPGYDIYIWLDADLWVQDGGVIGILARAAGRGLTAIAAEYDRAYKTTFKRAKLFGWTHNHKHYRLGFGWKTADRYGRMPILNSGAFSMPAASPVWRAWEDNLRAALGRSRHPLMEQTALNLALYERRDEMTILPAYCNWLCGAATPWLDEETQYLVEPFEPHQPLGLVHMAGEFSFDTVAELKTVQGRTVKSKLDYASWCALKDSLQNRSD